MLAIGSVNPPLGSGCVELWLWNCPLSNCRDALNHRNVSLVWVLGGGICHRLAGIPLRMKAPEDSVVLTGSFWSQSIKQPFLPRSFWSQSVKQPLFLLSHKARYSVSCFHFSFAQLTLEDFSCSVFFVEGRIILISTMQYTLLKNVSSC